MPSVTYDGRSFMLDGRRIWLVSGSVQYARTPRELWPARIHAAKLAGLNTIETPVFWNRHEPRPGQFDFTGDNDLRHFVELVGQAGMYCILRPGPYVGQAWDLGGLPSWLIDTPGVQPRTANGPFLEACSRYLTAVADQVRDRQVTSPGKGGPIILVQNESHWTCGHDDLAQRYLGELARYLREAGITVPIVNANNLWQGVEGEIDCWAGEGRMLATIRQLATVRPDQPRLVIEFNTGASTTWGNPAPKAPAPGTVQRRLAQVLAAGGQFNIHPFHGGTNLGFWGGRIAEWRDGYTTTSNDHQAPLAENGLPGPTYEAVRRLCTFASRFGRIFANLDPDFRPVLADPSPGEAGDQDSSCDCAVAFASGPQGGVAFLFGQDPARASGKGSPDRTVALLLPDGSRLPVPLGNQAVAWCLFDAYLGGRARLDYCNLNAFAVVGRVFVCYGPAGSECRVSINGSPLHVPVPKGKAPEILEHEGAVVVVASDEAVASIYAADDAIYVGVSGLTPAGEPLGVPGAKNCTRISSTGEISTVPAVAATPTGKRAAAAAPKASISEWAAASMAEYVDGSSARFASIPGPGELSALGSPYGYGWYRLRFKATDTGKTKLAMPHSGDRLHVSLDGERVGVIGRGPGAHDELSVSLKKGQHTMVVLAENLGRASGGVDLADPKGLYGHVLAVAPLKVGKPAIKRGEPVDVLKFRSPVWEVHEGELTHPDRVTWTFAHRRKTSVLVRFGAFHGRGLVIVNDAPVRLIDRAGSDRLLLEPEQLKTGNNTIQIALLPEAVSPEEEMVEPASLLGAFASSVQFFECTDNLSAKAEWAFAKWEPPPPSGYEPAGRAGRTGPTWWRARFEAAATDQPLMLDLTGMTKGQIYVNGRHLGRYFVATAEGKAVPPQSVYFVPGPWVHAGPDNELLLFDEHGGNPAKCRLFYGSPS